MLQELYRKSIISKEELSDLRGISNKELRQLMFDKGIDGTIYDNKVEKGGYSYSFISPNQIKSATDNIGTYSRTNDDIRYRVVDAINPTSNKNVKPNKFRDLSKEIQESLVKKGWTAEKFDSISQEERDQAIRCIAF